MEDRYACPANIGPRQRAKRRLVGWAAFIGALVAGNALIYTGAPRWWRLALFPLFALATYCFFQVRYRTCVRLAAKGRADFDAGEIPVDDPELDAALRAQAEMIRKKSLVGAVLATALALAFPA